MKRIINTVIKTLKMTAVLFFIPIISLTSCDQISVDDMLNEYNKAYDPDFGNKQDSTPLSELIPRDSYEVEYPNEIRINAKRGYFNYTWTLSDSSGKMYSCDTGMYVIYINTSSLGLEKGDYTLSVSAKDVSNNKYTDAAVVIVK